MVITIVAVLLAVALALFYNRWVWRPGQHSGRLVSDGLQIKEIAGPLASLAVLLLAFVLVQSFSSWSSAGRAEASEATATLLLFREADLIDNPRWRQDVRRQVVCYATSVIEQDWPAMRRARVSNVPPTGRRRFGARPFDRCVRAPTRPRVRRSSRATPNA
jgi:hypothetical protein